MSRVGYYYAVRKFSDNELDNIETHSEQTTETQQTNQQVEFPGRQQYNQVEQLIINSINRCLENWYKPWLDTFLADGREYEAIYNLMDGLLHYEYQICNAQVSLTKNRLNAVAQAVARLIDYGNAILNGDLIVRASDEISSELDPTKVTTMELYHAHVKAYNLRKKLLHDYFRENKRKSDSNIDDQLTSTMQSMKLQVPTLTNNLSSPSLHSPNHNRSHRASVGSNISINTISESGFRKSPSTSSQNIELVQNTTDFSESFEITHMTSTLKSSSFSSPTNPTTRLAMLPGILATIEGLLSVPNRTEKVSCCFRLLDALLDTLEKLNEDIRGQEVSMMAKSILKLIVKKVYIDDRDDTNEFQQAHWTACLISIMKLMNADNFNKYVIDFNNPADLGAFIKDFLFIVRRFIVADGQEGQQVDLDIVDKSKPTFPDCWIEMILLGCSSFLTSLTHLYQNLRQYFNSNTQMWSSFIDCLVNFPSKKALRPERVMLKKRQVLLALDIAKTSADYIWISWDSLTFDKKQSLSEDLTEPLLKAAMIMKSPQRRVLLPIFYDMMKCNYISQYVTPKTLLYSSLQNSLSPGEFGSNSAGAYSYASYEQDQQRRVGTGDPFEIRNELADATLPYLSMRDIADDGTVLTRFTHLIVGKIHSLVIELGLGDGQFRDELFGSLTGHTISYSYPNQLAFPSQAASSQFKAMARQTADLIREFMQICLDLRLSNKLAYKHLYLLCLFKLILFFRDKVDRPELYLQNLYKLCTLHHAAGRYVETGYTLLEHAKSLSWSDTPLDSHCRVISRYFKTDSHQLLDNLSLKLFLYNTIIEYFDRGRLWEAAVPLCRELIDLYQFKTYDYIKLAQVLHKMSTFFQNITNSASRSHSEYFRVTFYGCGFPDCIRGMTMLYRGRPYEKLTDFQSSILNKYPDTTLLTSLAKPNDQILNETGARYVQVNACAPVVNLTSKFNHDVSKIDASILEYYRYNECDKFEFSRRIDIPRSERTTNTRNNHSSDPDNFANMWRERTTLTTNTLPGLLPFFPVYLIETTTVTPIESAIEDLKRTNDRLLSFVNRFKADRRQEEDIRLLGQLLLGVVDAAVNGGITKYEDAFFGQATGSPTGAMFEPKSVNAHDLTDSGGHSGSVSNFQVNLEKYKQSRSPKSNNMSIKASPKDPNDTQQVSNLIDSFNNQLNGSHDMERQVNELKSLIAQQVPLLDEAIKLHADRVADVMRPQHEHLEAAYKKLKNHVMSKYSRYLPADYNRSSMRAYRSLARSPNRSVRADQRNSGSFVHTPNGSLSGRLSMKRLSDTGLRSRVEQNPEPGFSIPYIKLNNENRSSPYSMVSEDLTNVSRGKITSPSTSSNESQENEAPTSTDAKI